MFIHIYIPCLLHHAFRPKKNTGDWWWNFSVEKLADFLPTDGSKVANASNTKTNNTHDEKYSFLERLYNKLLLDTIFKYKISVKISFLSPGDKQFRAKF